MKRPIRFCFALMVVSAGALAQMKMHDHSAMAPAGDGKFNPFVISDAHGGFYSVYIERQSGKSDVYFQHADAGRPFSAAVRVNDKPGDGTVRNENLLEGRGRTRRRNLCGLAERTRTIQGQHPVFLLA